MKSRRVFLLAAAVLRLVAPVRRECPLERVRKILVIGSGGIGDLVMKTPLLSALRRGFPGAEIVLLTSSGPENEIVRGHPGVDRMILLEGREAFSLRHPFQIARYLRRLRAERFDLSVTTHYGISFGGAVFSYLAGAPVRAGFDKGGRGSLYTHRVEVDDPESRHAVDWNLSLAERLGIPAAPPEQSICLTPEERLFADGFLRDADVAPGQPVVALFQGSKRRSRLWLNHRFAQLADALASKYGARILLFGGEAELPAIRAIAGLTAHKPLVAVGQTVRETAALLERCGLLVSCDSGPVHIAAALKTPVVALFGPETPVRVRPYSAKSAVIWHRLECAPCHLDDCKFGAPRCMEAISVEEVLGVIRERAADWGLEGSRRA